MPDNPLSDVDSWLYFLGDVNNSNSAEIAGGDYGLIVMDYANYEADERPYTATELDTLRGDDPDRLVVSYLSIGEAESYRFYWEGDAFQAIVDEVLDLENPEWAENYKVRYWHDGWQDVMFSYVDRIIDAGFNGVYLDIIDAFEYWEERDPNSGLNYRQEMADFVAAIRAHAQTRLADVDPDREFVIMGQNGESLLENETYLAAIDGVGKEDLGFYYEYGNEAGFEAQSAEDIAYSIALLKAAEAAGVEVFSVEYLTTARQAEYADELQEIAELLRGSGIALYVAEARELDEVYSQPELLENSPLIGSIEADTLRGGAGRDFAYASDGNDKIWAGKQDDDDDIFIGGDGDDTIGGSVGGDLLVGDGFDEGPTKHWFSNIGDLGDSGNDVLFGNFGDDTVLGGGWDDGLVADNGRFDLGEEIVTDIGDNTLWAGDGHDLIIGAAGNDRLGGGRGNDTLRGEAGNDRIFGGGGTDTLNGGDGNDLIFNGAGDDNVDGGAGNDTLWGGPGSDTLAGGVGEDRFIFTATTGADQVSDFSVEDDILDLSYTSQQLADLELLQVASGNAVVGGKSGLLITISDGNSVFLVGVSHDDLDTMTILF